MTLSMYILILKFCLFHFIPSSFSLVLFSVSKQIASQILLLNIINLEILVGLFIFHVINFFLTERQINISNVYVIFNCIIRKNFALRLIIE